MLSKRLFNMHNLWSNDMSKVAIKGTNVRKARTVKGAGKKTVSHGTFRAQRKPNSPRVR
jgi:hypothetical protein